MKKTIPIIISALFFAGLDAGAQALSSMLVPSDPESAAMGGVSVASRANAFALDNNASAISLSEKTFAVGVSYGYWAPETSSNHNMGLGAFVRVSDRVGIGISGKYIMDRPMDITTESGAVTGRFTPHDLIGSAAVSVRVACGVAVGLTAKIANSSIGEGLSGTAFGADLSVAWHGKSFRAGAALCNAGSRISYGGDSYAIPMSVKAGAAWESSFGLEADIEADYLFSGAFMAGAGLEYSIFDIGFVRAGYHYGDRTEGLASFVSAGVGVRFAGLSLDFTYITASQTLNNTLLCSLGYSF